MTRPRPFRTEQRAVAARMAVALAVTIVVVGIALWWSPTTASFEMRLQSALRIQIAVWLCVAIAIGNVARLRFASPDDIAGSSEGAGSDVVRTANAVLRNTLEQAVLAGATYLALAPRRSRAPAVSSPYWSYCSSSAGCCSRQAIGAVRPRARSDSR